MPSAQPMGPSTTMAPMPSPPPPIGRPNPPPPLPESPRRSSILPLCSDSSNRIDQLHRPLYCPNPTHRASYSFIAQVSSPGPIDRSANFAEHLRVDVPYQSAAPCI